MYLLRHPNICKLVDWVSEGDYYYMFLEYVDGGQLLDYIIRHGKLREKQARKFARQIASALDYCHRNSIVHRDLKIENILITRDENIKIIDFGLSNIYSPSKLLSTFCGSLYFAAPELLKARHYTGPEVDVWSFGVVLYVLVCGRVPFDDTSLPALHAKIKSGIVDEYPDHLSKECVDLLSKILVVDPRKRLTLSAVENHPWMKKGYEEPIYSNIPQRQVLEKVDMDIVKGMHGFNLGDDQLIRSKLERLIKTPEYKEAVIKIEQNQHLEWQRQNQTPVPRWRRSLTPIGKKLNQADDDPLSLPAMYDPLLSIYYLVKERKEYD
ncbi:kinase-like domain-containing protein, partial [Chlamydoabsidia padenii]